MSDKRSAPARPTRNGANNRLSPQERALQGRRSRSPSRDRESASGSPRIPGGIRWSSSWSKRRAASRSCCPFDTVAWPPHRSPFLRGAAAVMADDLGVGPSTGLRVQLCGDAHLIELRGIRQPRPRPRLRRERLRRDASGSLRMGRAAPRGQPRDRRTVRVTSAEGPTEHGPGVRLGVSPGHAELRLHALAGRRYSYLDAAGIKQRWGTGISADAMRIFELTATKAETKDNLKAFTKLTQQSKTEKSAFSATPAPRTGHRGLLGRRGGRPLDRHRIVIAGLPPDPAKEPTHPARPYEIVDLAGRSWASGASAPGAGWA